MKLDYDALGFKAGLEIHQELNTQKLFCSCSNAIKEDDLISTAKRKLRSAAGETGEIDLASAYEQLRSREFFYNSYKNESCLVELDEEPPHPVNKEAFKIALGVSRMFRLNVPDTICVMRKTVTDGSAVSGFQRTMVVGLEGKESVLETSKGQVKIVQLNLEEDSAKIIKKEDSKVYYSLSRLGVPLLEIGTDASLKDPEHVRETAYEIGTLLRSFNVKRGLGTIRQDVNISIREGARIEVKGWQDLKKIQELVLNEVLRQCNLLEIKKELSRRKLKKFKKELKDVTDIFLTTESKIIKELIEKNSRVYALLLPKFSGLLKKELCSGKTFGKELSEYAKAYGTKGMIHTDEDLSKYKLEGEFEKIKQLFKSKADDLIVVIAEENEIAKKAANSVFERALYCTIGVPKETRIPNHNDATSSYARPLPGAHRLYPETDIPNIDVGQNVLNSIKLPELLPDKIQRFSKQYGIDKSTAKELLSKDSDFEDYVRRHKNIEPKFMAHMLIEMPKEIRRRYAKDINAEKYAGELFLKLNKNDISKDAVFEILVEIAHDKKIDYSRYRLMSDSEIEKEIKKIITENNGLPENAIIGKVMEKLRGKADGKKIVGIVRKHY